MKSLPFVAIASTITISGVLFLASHFVTDTTADAATSVHTLQAPQPNPHKAPPAAQAPAAPARTPDRKVESKPEAGDRHVTERIDRSKRNELCKKLEQRREQLRQEKKAERKQAAEAE